VTIWGVSRRIPRFRGKRLYIWFVYPRYGDISSSRPLDRANQTIDEAVQLSNAFGDPVHAVHVLSQAEFVEIEQTEAKQRNTAIGMDQIREYASRVAEDASNDIDASIECGGTRRRRRRAHYRVRART